MIQQDRPSGKPYAIVTTTVPITLELFQGELIRQLSREYRIALVSSAGSQLGRVAKAHGADAHPIDMAREISPLRDGRALWDFFTTLRRLKPELIVAATPKASLLGLTAALLARVPERLYLVYGFRFEGTRGLKRHVLVAMEKVTGRSATAIVSISPSLTRVATQRRLYSTRKLSSTHPASSHGVDCVRFHPLDAPPTFRQELGLVPDVLTIGFAGRLTHDKGLDTLIDAATELARRGVQFQLLVIGAPSELDSKVYLSRLRALHCHTIIIDHAPPREMPKYYNTMDVHVLPSLREGFPNVVLEAAACGVPTVTTAATGCIDSVVDNVTGLLVPPRDGMALADSLQKLLMDSPMRQRMGKAALDRVRSDFQPANVVKSLLKPIEAL